MMNGYQAPKRVSKNFYLIFNQLISDSNSKIPHGLKAFRLSRGILKTHILSRNDQILVSLVTKMATISLLVHILQ